MISSFFDDVNSLDCYTEYLSIFRWWSHHFNPLSYCDVTPPPPPLRRTLRLLLLTSKQIASFFSSLSKSQRAKNIDEGNHGIETEDEEPNIQDKNLQLLQLVLESQVQADHGGKDQNPSTRYTEKGMFVAGRRSYWIQSKEGLFCSCTRQVHLHPPIQELQILSW